MREIKFRGKRINNGEWVYGYLIGNDVIVGDIVEFSDEYFNTEFWYKVDPKTVGQFGDEAGAGVGCAGGGDGGMNLEMNQTCPYCGYEEEDYCANWEEEAEKVECSHCDKTYSARAVYKFLGFETQKICEECGEIEEECYCELAVMEGEKDDRTTNA